MDSKRVRCARVMPSEDVERPLLDQSPISSTLRYAICISKDPLSTSCEYVVDKLDT
eukprot:COSAG02_NODE_7212_length_3117_cov_1.444997_2_plen_56_part_00